MNRSSDAFSELWEASIEGLQLDFAPHTVLVQLITRRGEELVAHRVTFAQVTNLRVTVPRPIEWERVEATSWAHTEREDGQHEVEIVTWSDDAGIAITCGSYEIS